MNDGKSCTTCARRGNYLFCDVCAAHSQYEPSVPMNYILDANDRIDADPQWPKANPHMQAPFQPHILDSGNRREFESGAVRDIQEGKGRCDLLPLDVVAEYLRQFVSSAVATPIQRISEFQETGDVNHLLNVLYPFVMNKNGWKLNHSTMLLEVSIHFEEGAKKYGDNNWQKGIPVRCYIDSAVRHYFKFLRGDKDEPHDRAFVWNIMCAIWTCKHKPELNDYAPVTFEKAVEAVKDEMVKQLGIPKHQLFVEGE